jgi:hypothetical protein
MSKATPAEVDNVARVMRKEAKRVTGKAPAFRILRGWKFGLSYGPVPVPERAVTDAIKGPIAERIGRPDLAAATYEEIAAAAQRERQWIFSASLHPRGRSSVDADWELLGQMTFAVGAPEGSCATPIETTHPNDVHYWIWEEELGPVVEMLLPGNGS